MPSGWVRRRSGWGTVLLCVLALVVGCASSDDGAVGLPAPPSTGDAPVVHTADGAVRGVATAEHRFFGGIPYAAAPVGQLRWREPAPVVAWPDVRDASEPGPRCIQAPGGDLEFGRHSDEDCLTLNVWTPPVGAGAPSDDPWPVLVWIHGGGFVNGSGGMFDSRWLVERGDIVVVTLNYRLGALGFLAHPAFGPLGSVGNYGLTDQQAGLRWVRDSIADFGGDPDRVTIAGESAGGMAVCDHLVAPDSQELFHAAIVMSGPCQGLTDVSAAEQISLDYAADAGCGDPATAADCLRELPTDKLREPVSYFRLGADLLSGPVFGAESLPDDPIAAIADGRAARVPVLIGTNRDEFTLFAGLRYLREGQRYTAADYPLLLGEMFGADAPAVADRYPLDRYDSVALAYSAAVTDALFAWVGDRIADDLAQDSPVYAYEFNDPDAPAPDPLRTLPFPVGASHSLELRYLFDVGGAPELNREQRVLSEEMIDFWSHFVATGTPGAGWPALGDDPAAGPRMLLQPDGSRVVTDFEQVHQCEFWAGLAQ